MACSNDEMKTSEEWYAEIPKEYGFIIVVPDGWDRRRLHFSFYEEIITKRHFLMRVQYSTCSTNVKIENSDWANS